MSPSPESSNILETSIDGPTKISIKRKATSEIPDDANANKDKKPRARIACSTCRSRKVRCDVEKQWKEIGDRNAPCRNCVMDSKICVIQASKRKRRRDLSIDLQSPKIEPSSPRAFTPHSPAGFEDFNDTTQRYDPRLGMPIQHTPHFIYQQAQATQPSGMDLLKMSSILPQFAHQVYPFLNRVSMTGDLSSTPLDDLQFNPSAYDFSPSLVSRNESSGSMSTIFDFERAAATDLESKNASSSSLSSIGSPVTSHAGTYDTPSSGIVESAQEEKRVTELHQCECRTCGKTLAPSMAV